VNIHICPPSNPLTSPFSVKRPGIGANARVTTTDAKHAVAISHAAQQLANLQSCDADIDLLRVHAIRAAIAAADLTIDTSRIADGLIASARELLKEDEHACAAG